jgi:hypothetical protein
VLVAAHAADIRRNRSPDTAPAPSAPSLARWHRCVTALGEAMWSNEHTP